MTTAHIDAPPMDDWIKGTPDTLDDLLSPEEQAAMDWVEGVPGPRPSPRTAVRYEHTSVMIALLPTGEDVSGWAYQDLPHVTVVWAGERADVSDGRLAALREACATWAKNATPLVVPVTGTDVFGEGEDRVKVLTLELTPELAELRAAVEWANASQYKDYKPHATCGPESLRPRVPEQLVLTELLLAVGPDHMIWPLDNGTRVSGLGGQFAKGGGRVPGRAPMLDGTGPAYAGGGSGRTADSVHAELEAHLAEAVPRNKRAQELLDYLGSSAYYSNRPKAMGPNKTLIYPHMARAEWSEIEPKWRADKERTKALVAEETGLRIKERGDVAAIDPDGARWASKTLADGVQMTGEPWSSFDPKSAGKVPPEMDSDAFKKARDRYVVADTPTLKMNAALRGEKKMTPGDKQRAAEARELSGNTTTADALVHRTMALTPAQAASIVPGQRYENRGFQSAQANHESIYNRTDDLPGTTNVQVTIRVPAGTHVGDVGYGEIVLRPGASTVVSSEWDGQNVKVVMTYDGEL